MKQHHNHHKHKNYNHNNNNSDEDNRRDIDRLVGRNLVNDEYNCTIADRDDDNND